MKALNKDTLLALKLLNDKGYEAYIVGGAVRNQLLNLKIDDFDITTNAKPNEIKKVFKKYHQYPIGEKHGTIVVNINKTKIDITTYRVDNKYIDHRHPKNVNFTKNLQEDLKRRDFTINALCINKDNNIIDLFNGLKDIKTKTIKAIGDPGVRFNEDALRILRAIRFSAKYDFKIEKQTKQEMFENKDLLKYISNERKKEELLQILNCKNKQKIINDYLDIFNTFININKIDKKINNFNNNYYALAYLLSKSNNNNLKNLKFSNNECQLLNSLMIASYTNLKKDYDFISLLSNNYTKEILLFINQLYKTNYSVRYKNLKKYMVNKNTLKLNGFDLMKLGYKNKEIKFIQDELVKQIRNKKLENTKKALTNYLKSK